MSRFFCIFAFMKGNNLTLEYIYEYMIKKAVPVSQYPATFNTVMTLWRNSGHQKTKYLFPYSNESILDVVGLLLLNSDSEDDNVPHQLHHKSFGNVLVNSTNKSAYPIRDKYPFRSKHLALIEFYDFLLNLDDNFIVTLKLEIFTNSLNAPIGAGFKISLSMITIMNSDGQLGNMIIREARERWFKLGKEKGYHYNFYALVDKELDLPIYKSTYLLNEKERED